MGRGKRHFQHSLTVEKALCEPGGAWRAGGLDGPLPTADTSYLHRVLQHLRKVRIGLDVGVVGNVCRQFGHRRFGGRLGLLQVAEERVGQRHDLAWARIAGVEHAVAFQPHQAQRLQCRAGDALLLGVLGMSCITPCGL